MPDKSERAESIELLRKAIDRAYYSFRQEMEELTQFLEDNGHKVYTNPHHVSSEKTAVKMDFQELEKSENDSWEWGTLSVGFNNRYDGKENLVGNEFRPVIRMNQNNNPEILWQMEPMTSRQLAEYCVHVFKAFEELNATEDAQ